MLPNQTELVETRKHLALIAIQQAFTSTENENSVQHFAQFHVDELPEVFWKKYIGSHKPSLLDVINLIEHHSSWGVDDIEYFDFMLPDDVSQYVLSVHFKSDGSIDDICMDS